MGHRFTKGVADYASGQLELMLQRMEQHREKHQGQNPAFFVLHPPSSAALNAEHYKRFGVPHQLQLAGVPIRICHCASAPVPPERDALAFDWMATADGLMEML